MPHTPLNKMLRQAAAAAREATARGEDGDRIVDEQWLRRTSRRDFVMGISLGSAAAAFSGSSVLAKKPSPPAARVVVVGAGLAGLTCAYRLKQAGINATVYEANSRVGGRCWTRRGDFEQGQIAEHGGELIDQGHTQMRHLAQELDLPLDNLLTAEPKGTEPFYYFGGAPYTYREAVDDLKGIWQKLHRDLVLADFPTLYNRFTPRAAQLDEMSIDDWINENVPGGMNSPLGQLLVTAYTIEYGAESSVQSSLNLLYLLGYNSPGQFSVFGASDEKYHVRGGNDRVATTLAGRLVSQIVSGAFLVKVRLNPAGTYTLTFQNGSSTFTAIADKVVFALPFSILREAVDLSSAGFSDLKMTAIDELPMGTSAKLHLQFSRRHWYALGNSGETFADTGLQNTWEVTRGQAGSAGILVDYTGGNIGNSFGVGTPAARAQQFLAQIEPILPGLSTAWNGRATIDYWPANPFSRGSYPYYRVGQYLRFAGIEPVQERNAHFCGDHTSIEAQGYLEGAVETGQRAAAEVIADLRR